MLFGMPARVATAITFVLILLFVLGCGQKDDLYLPDDTAASYAKGSGVAP